MERLWPDGARENNGPTGTRKRNNSKVQGWRTGPRDPGYAAASSMKRRREAQEGKETGGERRRRQEFRFSSLGLRPRRWRDPGPGIGKKTQENGTPSFWVPIPTPGDVL